LREVLKQYLELDSTTIEDFIQQFEADWKAVIGQVLTEEQTTELLGKLLGEPNSIKSRT